MAAAVAVAEGGSAHEVDKLLQVAYGVEFGKTGHSLAGHTVIDEADVASVIEKGQGSSLLYGELLPEGVARLAEALFLGRGEVSGPLLELGMGTGKAALQLFLSLRRDVYGVELAPSRWALADLAIQKLAETVPERFRYELVGEGAARLHDLSAGVVCDLVCGSLFDTPTSLVTSASSVVLEVCLPKEAQRLAAGLLQHCSSGCRVVCYAPLHGFVEGCRLAPVSPRLHQGAIDKTPTFANVLGDCAGGLRLPTSWKDIGHGFAFYELAASAEAAQEAWTGLAGHQHADRVDIDMSGNPSRGKKTRYTDEMLPQPEGSYKWGRGDKVLVGYSWLPFLDLGNPGDGSADGLDGVTWMHAQVISVDDAGFATICYQDDGTIEEEVHPERIRMEGCLEQRQPIVIDWGDDAE
mmetsp:Transcript_35099/g.64156  ORF Transcript_35099/g.64156 Transcript_35099/m.64156 type:complete len:409 (-) Transcript_35099:27-1253(-)